MALTKRDVDSLTYQGRRLASGWSKHIVYDGDLPGFGVQVFPSGEKRFVLRYRNRNGRDRQVTLGRYGVLTLAQGRDAARRELLKIGQGADPVAERQLARGTMTLREFADIYIDRHAKPQKRSWRVDRARLDRHVLPALGGHALTAVTRADVATFHARLGRRAPVEANRILALLSVMFSKAIAWGFLEEDAANPASRVEKFKERSRDNWVKPAEMPALVEAINAEPGVYPRGLFWLYLLTGLRRSELLGLRWTDIDLERNELRVGQTKADRPHVLPLSAPALRILENLPRLDGNPHVFPGRREGRPIANVDKAWRRVRARLWLATHPEKAAEFRDRAELEVRRRPKHAARSPRAVESRVLDLAAANAISDASIHLHDLRRTVGSWLATDGASLPLIGRVLNHSNPSVTAIYAKLADDPVRAALERHGELVVRAGMGRAGERGA